MPWYPCRSEHTHCQNLLPHTLSTIGQGFLGETTFWSPSVQEQGSLAFLAVPEVSKYLETRRTQQKDTGGRLQSALLATWLGAQSGRNSLENNGFRTNKNESIGHSRGRKWRTPDAEDVTDPRTVDHRSGHQLRLVLLVGKGG